MRAMSASSSAVARPKRPPDGADDVSACVVLGQRIGEVERSQHGDALARSHLAAVADRAHFAVDLVDRLEQRHLAALRAAEHVALPMIVTSICFIARSARALGIGDRIARQALEQHIDPIAAPR
jgi:hypothetical protein